MSALRKILVVDDDPVVGKSFSRVLSNKGYVVITAHDGPEALKRLAEGDYDAVFTDIRMPGMDGIEVAERVKARRPWTPVVIITGYGTEDNEARAKEAGVADFIRKPLSPDMIEGSARKAVETAPVPAPLAAAARTEPLAHLVSAPPAVPAEPDYVAPRRGLLGTLEPIGMMVVAPLVALAYIVAAPFVGLAMLAWMGLAAAAGTRLGRYAKSFALMLAMPFVGLAYAIALPFIGLAALARLGWSALREGRALSRIAVRAGRRIANIVLFLAAPFIGLAYALAFPFIGLYLMIKGSRKGGDAE